MAKETWQGAELGGWVVHERRGAGGNGVVYRATRGAQEGAIKVLKPDLWTGKRYARFKDEIEGLRRCEGIPGVMPLLDFNIPDKPVHSDPPWIVMGYAELLTAALGTNASLIQVVEACLEIADALTAMHAKGLSHRDIKPDNLFRFQGRWAVGDLGLVDFEDKVPVTAEGEKLGPMFYIAPEMLNNAATADGQTADVYSFAKALWVLATGQRFPLPGEMRRTIPALTVSAYVQDSRAILLDPVIEAATSFDPMKRPTMEGVTRELRVWLFPQTFPTNADELDLSAFASEIEGINERHHVRQEQIREEHAFIAREGFRLRELFRPAVQRIVAAIQQAKFINSKLSIDNHTWGFEGRGYILATAWPGEVVLKLQGWIHIKPEGWVTIECRYAVQVNEDGKTTNWDLWKDSASFLAGGADEQQEIGRLIAGMTGQLRGCVDRVLRMSKGEEGTPHPAK